MLLTGATIESGLSASHCYYPNNIRDSLINNCNAQGHRA